MLTKSPSGGTFTVLWSCLVLLIVLDSGVKSFILHNAKTSSVTPVDGRDSKFLGLFSILKIQNNMCTVGDEMGTCTTLTDCLINKGSKIGLCAGGLGICCQKTITCGGESSINVTYIQNADYPSYTTSSGTCEHNIKLASNICNLRLDFDEFEMYKPYRALNDASNGYCQYDFMKVTGTSVDMFDYLCGKMPPVWHFYLGVRDKSGPITFTTTMSSSVTQNRRWNIKVTQISCDRHIPQGCGQWFTGLEHDDLYSFNWGNNGMYLQGMNYAICYRQEKDYCTHSFTDTGNSWIACVDSLGFSSTDTGSNNALNSNGVDHRDCNVVALANVWPSPITTNNHGPTYIYFSSDRDNSFRYLPAQPSSYSPGFHFSVTPNACA